LIFKSKTEKFADTRYGIMELFKKPGLVNEALGRLGDLTPEQLYHIYARVKRLKSYKNFAISNFLVYLFLGIFADRI